MRRIDPFTFAFLMRSMESNRLADVMWGTFDTSLHRSTPESPDPEPAGHELEEEPIKSWESAWIDLGGEG
jgi:hypothetical protein